MSKTAKYTAASLNMLIFGAVLFVNYFYASKNAISAMSDEYMTLLTPADYTFSIWGVIYTLALACNVRFFIMKDIPLNVFIFQMLLMLLNASWVVLWTMGMMTPSWVIMLAMLGVLIYINRQPMEAFMGEYFGIYYMWIAAATALQTMAAMAYWGVSVELRLFMAVIAVLALAWAALGSDRIFAPFTFVWAGFGIFFQRVDIMENQYMFRYFVLAAACLITIFRVYVMIMKAAELYKSRKKSVKKPKSTTTVRTVKSAKTI